MTDEAGQPDLVVSALEYGSDGACAVVFLAGQAGITDCGWIRLLLGQEASRGPRHVVVDLSRLSSMDWWVALMLTWAGRVVSRRGGVLTLAAPQPAVARLLRAAGAPAPAIVQRLTGLHLDRLRELAAVPDELVSRHATGS